MNQGSQSSWVLCSASLGEVEVSLLSSHLGGPRGDSVQVVDSLRTCFLVSYKVRVAKSLLCLHVRTVCRSSSCVWIPHLAPVGPG